MSTPSQLVAALRSAKAATRASAACSISKASAAAALAIADAGALQPLVALLQAGTDAGKAAAAGAVWSLAVELSLCSRIADAGALQPLVALLQAGTDEGKTAAAGAMCNLSVDPSLRSRIADAGALQPLVVLLQAGTDAAKTSSAGAVRNLAADPSLRSRIADAGALQPLVALLQAGTDAAKAAAADAMRNLAADPSLRSRIADAGALQPLVALLQAGTDAGKAAAATALCNLALDPSLCSLIADAGALQPLVALLQAGTDAGKAAAATALWNLAVDRSLRSRIADAGALQPLVALLQAGTDAAKTAAADAMRNLAADPSLRSRIADAGALQPLVTLLTSGDEYAAGALRMMVEQVELRSAALESGMLEALASQIPTCNDAFGLHASAAFSSLAEEPGLLERILAAGVPSALAEAAAARGGHNWAADALLKLCPTREDAVRALRLVGQKLDQLEQQSLSMTQAFAQMAALARAPSEGSKHDVVFTCADGVEIGGSQLLLTHASPYFRSLLGAHTAEGASGRVALDNDFSSYAHAALLGQSHAMGQAPLPADFNTLLELLCLAAKVRAPSADAIECLLKRCEEAVMHRLDATSCLDVLLRLKPCGEFRAIEEAAERLAAEHLEQVIAQDTWTAFREELPKLACELMENIARARDPPAAVDKHISASRKRKAS
jgi:vacuolar protein 8